MNSTKIIGATVTGALLASNLLIIESTQAATTSWIVPVAKQLTFSPPNAVIGASVKITCIVGGTQKIQLDTNTPKGKYLASGRKPSWTLPVEILVNNVPIGKWDLPGLASPASTWQQTASWAPGPGDAGKVMSVQCVVDKDQKMFYSTTSAGLNVFKPAPRVEMKDQKPQNAIQIPGGPKLPSPPSR